jgi:light-regulated signal transduction histidine kinase (bacteriophytochrome)
VLRRSWVNEHLKAPLRHVEGFSRALLEDYGDKLDEKGKDLLKRLDVASTLMAEFLEKLAELSSVAMADLIYEELNLSELVQNEVTRLQGKNPARQVEFIVRSGLLTTGDSRVLKIAISNLLENAFKFTGKVAKPKIEFGVTVSHDKEAYFIKDNGVGFDTAYAKNLFAPFVRLHNDDAFPGLGAGLAIFQRIIRRHSGDVWVESEVGKGATFYFTLG